MEDLDKRAKMCYGKKSYSTKKRANKTAQLFNQRVYLCPYCHTYHLTTKNVKQ